MVAAPHCTGCTGYPIVFQVCSNATARRRRILPDSESLKEHAALIDLSSG